MVEGGILEAFVRVGGYGPTRDSGWLPYPTPQKIEIQACTVLRTSQIWRYSNVNLAVVIRGVSAGT